MANIGPTTAFYKVETSLTHMHSEVGNSRERIAAGKQSAHAGDRASNSCLLYTSPSPRDATLSRMPSSA